MNLKSIFAIAVFCGTLLFAEAAEPLKNLLKNGDFAQIKPNGTPNFWSIRSNANNSNHYGSWKVLKEDGVPGNIFSLSISPNPVKKTDAINVNQFFPAEQFETFELEMLVRVIPPKDGDYGCGPIIIFTDKDKKWLTHQSLPQIAFSVKGNNKSVTPKEGFFTYKQKFTAKAGAKGASVRIDLWGPNSRLDIANVKITKVEKITDIQVMTKAADLPDLPASGATATYKILSYPIDWTNKGADILRSKNRERISLSNLWAVRPVNAKAEGWAYQHIPGKIKDSYPTFILYSNDKTKFSNVEDGARWLYRTVDVPLRKDGRYFLQFDFLKECGVNVFWNGKSIGLMNAEWGGKIELPGDEVRAAGNQLLLFAQPRSHERQNEYFYDAGIGACEFNPVGRYGSAAIGYIDLITEGKAKLFDSVRINTSWRNKKLTVSFLKDDKYKNLHYSLSVKDKDGNEVLVGRNMIATENGNRQEIVQPWSNPIEWTSETPNLLYLTVSAFDEKGQLVDESLPTKFGFREVWRDGKLMYINGKELRLRTRLGYFDGFYESKLRRIVSLLKDIGFNTIYRVSGLQWFYGEYGGSSVIDIADEMGMFIQPPLPTCPLFFSPVAKDMWQIDSLAMKYTEKTLIDKYYNNPSVIAYTASIGGFNFESAGGTDYTCAPNVWGINPINTDAKLDEAIKKYDFPKDKSEQFRYCMKFLQNVKNLDPSRPHLTHIDMGAGDGWGTFTYFNFMPIQEETEWLYNYMHHGVMPIGSTEHGVPYHMSFINHNDPGCDGEPWALEYSAMVLGEKAYLLSTPAYRKELVRKYRPKLKSWGDGRKHPADKYLESLNLSELMAIRNKPIYRGWRLAGINMGIEPFGSATFFMDLSGNQKVRGKLGIKPDENMKAREFKEEFPAWTIPFSPDSLTYPQAPTGKMPAMLNPFGKVLYENNNVFLGYLAGNKDNPFEQIHIFKTGEIVNKQIAFIYDGFSPLNGKVSGIVMVDGKQIAVIDEDFSFQSAGTKLIPFDFKASKAGKGVVRLKFTSDKGVELGNDTFAFDVLNPVKPEVKGVVLYDPAGTSAGLKDLAEKTVAKEDFKDAGIVMVAPGAFTPALWKNLPAGMPVLVMAQDWKTFRSLGLIAHPIRIRNAYPDSSFAIPEDLLRDWRAGKPIELKDGDFKPEKPGYTNKISSTGMLARTVIETPTAGNFTPLAHCGFDLASTPILKAEIEGHPVIFCQLEIEPNAKIEPAVPVVMNELFRILREKQAPLTQPMVLGDAAPLKAVGADQIQTGLTGEGTVLVEKCTDIPDLKQFVEKGGTAVVLPQTDEFYKAFGVPFKRGKHFLYQAKIPGLNLGNYHSRVEIEMVMFNGTAILEKNLGKGKLVVLGFNPENIDPEKTPWLRFTKRRQHRALAQILTNCGMKLEVPGKSLIRHLFVPPYKYDMVEQKASVVIRLTVPGEEFYKLDFDASSWKKIAPHYGLQSGFPDAQIRWEFKLTAADIKQKGLILDAGTFDDFDETYLNGELIGSTTDKNFGDNAYSHHRFYPVRDGLLKEGNNVLAIRFWNRNGLTKKWQAWLRGPLVIYKQMKYPAIYADEYRVKDDPYNMHPW